MWLFTNFGFFSIVQKSNTIHLTVRARVKSDLDILRDQYLPELGPTIGKAGSDYPWRASVPHAALAAAMGKIVMELNYSNFKNEVAARQGKARASRYHKVWDALYDMPEGPTHAIKPGSKSKTLPWPETIPPGMKVAYGGVLFNTEGKVLLREPRGHFDGYVWTFPKGRPDPGESPDVTALREVKEETGVPARILVPIPGDFAGGTTINRFFLMTQEGTHVPISAGDPETASICWVHPHEARALIEMTTNPKGRQRDLAVLQAANKEWANVHH